MKKTILHLVPLSEVDFGTAERPNELICCRPSLEKLFPKVKGAKKINLTLADKPFKGSLPIQFKAFRWPAYIYRSSVVSGGLYPALGEKIERLIGPEGTFHVRAVKRRQKK